MFTLTLTIFSLLNGISIGGSNEQPGQSSNTTAECTSTNTPNEFAGIRLFNPETEVETRIIGGQEAWAHSWPWQVSLRFATMPACGGAVIAPLWIVTAAHCFKRYKKASSWTAMAGKHDLDNPYEPYQQLVGVSRIISHQGYNIRTKEYDLALLRLRTPLEFNRFVRPIEIWMKPLEPFRMCTITGWGSTRENGPRVTRLQEANVTCLPSDTCNRFYRGRIRSTMFCAGAPEGGVDACQGDSGGPLSCYTGRRYELAGLVSWGVGCGRARKPGVYTKMQDHVDWISNAMSTDQNKMSGDSGLNGEENDDTCSEAEMPPCRLGGPPATLTEPGDAGEVTVGGVTEACPNSWPWQVSLRARRQHYCSGSLIHRRWVLAPRHCYAKAGDVAVLGVHHLRFMASQSITVDEVFHLAQDGTFPPSTDLSLLRLASPARLDASVFPVCVPDEDIEVDDSWSCVTTSWRATNAIDGVKRNKEVSPNTLHQARVSLVNSTACRLSWGADIIKDTHLCSHPAGAASCTGDSGTPLFCQKRGVFYLFGLVTWGNQNCDATKPAVFSSISAFHPWISDITDDV